MPKATCQTYALCSIALLVLSACSTGESDNEQNTAGEAAVKEYSGSVDWLIQEVPGQPITVPKDMLHAVALEDRRTIHDKQEEAIKSCMAEQGFEYEPQSFPEDDGEVRSLAYYFEGMTPLGDVDAARKSGYGPPLERDLQGPSGQDDSDPPGFFVALIGGEPADGEHGVIKVDTSQGPIHVNTNSCVGKANGAVFGDSAQFTELEIQLDDIRDQMEDIVSSDPDYLQVRDQWQTCMKDRGFAGEEKPEHFRNTLSSFLQQGQITESEYYEKSKESAVDNAECVNSSGYVQAYNTAVEKAARQVGVKAESTLSAYREITDKALDKA